MEKISIGDISKIQEGSQVYVKGFLVQDGGGRIFLVSQPDVRSCCLGKKGLDQVLLKDLQKDLLPSHVVEVSGLLYREAGQQLLLQPAIHTVEPTYDLWAFGLLALPIITWVGWRKLGGNLR
ncbi:MAG: hypothetical protein ACK5MA_04105 [Parachlamydiaceae bacterium]